MPVTLRRRRNRREHRSARTASSTVAVRDVDGEPPSLARVHRGAGAMRIGFECVVEPPALAHVHRVRAPGIAIAQRSVEHDASREQRSGASAACELGAGMRAVLELVELVEGRRRARRAARVRDWWRKARGEI